MSVNALWRLRGRAPRIMAGVIFSFIVAVGFAPTDAHAVIQSGTPLSLGQYCTAVFGGSDDPRCLSQGLAGFKAECLATQGMQLVENTADPLGFNSAAPTRCIVGSNVGPFAPEGGCGILQPGTPARETCENHAALRRRMGERLRSAADPRNANLQQRLEQVQDSLRRMVEQPEGGVPFNPDRPELRGSPSTITGPIGYAPESTKLAAKFPDTLAATRPVATGPNAPVYSLGDRFAVWASGFADRERFDSTQGLNDGGKATSSGGLGGAHYVFRGLLGYRDAFALGAFGGYSSTDVRYNDQLVSLGFRGPSAGLYGVYVNGGWGLDVSSAWDWFELNGSTASDPVVSSARFLNYTAMGNLRYRHYGGPGWIEPIIGVRYVQTSFNGTSDFSDLGGHTVRVQGGARIGTSFDVNGVRVTPTLTGLLYSDVVIHGYTPADPGFESFARAEGRLYEQAILKTNFDFGGGFSLFAAGDFRHGDLGGGRSVYGAGGQGGLVFRW